MSENPRAVPKTLSLAVAEGIHSSSIVGVADWVTGSKVLHRGTSRADHTRNN